MSVLVGRWLLYLVPCCVGPARNAFALKVPLTEERLVCRIVGGARTVHV